MSDDALTLCSTDELVARLERVRERALGDSFCVEGDRCVGQAEHDQISHEQDDTQAVIDEAIRRLKGSPDER